MPMVRNIMQYNIRTRMAVFFLPFMDLPLPNVKSPAFHTNPISGVIFFPFSVSVEIYCFMPFYVLYVFLMGLQIQFAQSTFGIGRRYRRLNEALEAAYPVGKYPYPAYSNRKTMCSCVFARIAQTQPRMFNRYKIFC